MWLRQSEQSLLGVSRPVAIELCSLLKGLAFYSNWTGDTLWGFKQKNARITLTAVWRPGYWRREVRTEGPGCPGVGWRWLWEYWGIEHGLKIEPRGFSDRLTRDVREEYEDGSQHYGLNKWSWRYHYFQWESQLSGVNLGLWKYQEVICRTVLCEGDSNINFLLRLFLIL